jgi:hypothetical protein
MKRSRELAINAIKRRASLKGLFIKMIEILIVIKNRGRKNGVPLYLPSLDDVHYSY